MSNTLIDDFFRPYPVKSGTLKERPGIVENRYRYYMPKPVVPVATSQPGAEEILPARVQAEKVFRTKINRQQIVAMGLVAAVTIALGIFSQDLVRGQQTLAIYTLMAFILRLDSRLSFALGLFGIVLTASLGAAPPAANFIVYSFFFLLIGLTSALIELWRESRRK